MYQNILTFIEIYSDVLKVILLFLSFFIFSYIQRKLRLSIRNTNPEKIWARTDNDLILYMESIRNKKQEMIPEDYRLYIRKELTKVIMEISSGEQNSFSQSAMPNMYKIKKFLEQTSENL